MYESDLPTMLNTLAGRYTEQRRYKEAADLYEEIVARHRRLAEANPSANLPPLAGMLYNLGSQLAAMSQYPQALRHCEESVRIFRALASANPSKHNVELAKSLTVYAQIRMQAGTDLRQALADVQEALAILGALDPGPGVSGYYVVAFTTLTDILEKLGATGQARQLREMLEKKRASG